MKRINWIIAGVFCLAMAVKGNITTVITAPVKPFPPVEQDPFAGITLPTPGTPGLFEPIELNPGDLQELRHLNNTQLAAFLGSLSVTPLLPFNNLPFHGRAGTFYSLQHPEWPPLPADFASSSTWQMNGFYLMNDLTYDYVAAAAAAEAAAKAAAEAANPPSKKSKLLASAIKPGVQAKLLDPNGPPILTVAQTNGTQLLITITNPKNPQNYELLSTPILANSSYPWTPIAVGTTGQTNFTVNMGPYFAGFFRALQDTNAIPFWQAADPNNQATGVLTVYIDNPANATQLQ